MNAGVSVCRALRLILFFVITDLFKNLLLMLSYEHNGKLQDCSRLSKNRLSDHVLLKHDSLSLKVTLVDPRSVTNKTFIINSFFLTQKLDFLFVTEAWLNASELSPLFEFIPGGCNFFSSPRTLGQHGGLLLILSFKLCLLTVDAYSTFEVSDHWPVMTAFFYVLLYVYLLLYV